MDIRTPCPDLPRFLQGKMQANISTCSLHPGRFSNRTWRFSFSRDAFSGSMWATGKTLIAKCDLGSKLSFSGVRYIVLQCFLPPSKRSPLKCMQEHFSQRHVRFCSVFHCFALILLVRIDRLKSKDFSYEPFDFWGIHHVKAFYAEMVIVWLSFWLSFNPM